MKLTVRQLRRIIREAMGPYVTESDPQEVADILWSYMNDNKATAMNWENIGEVTEYSHDDLAQIASDEAGIDASPYIEAAISILVNDGTLAREYKTHGTVYYNRVGSSGF